MQKIWFRWEKYLNSPLKSELQIKIIFLKRLESSSLKMSVCYSERSSQYLSVFRVIVGAAIFIAGLVFTTISAVCIFGWIQLLNARLGLFTNRAALLCFRLLGINSRLQKNNKREISV